MIKKVKIPNRETDIVLGENAFAQNPEDGLYWLPEELAAAVLEDQATYPGAEIVGEPETDSFSKG
jgi:hypothetical protein